MTRIDRDDLLKWLSNEDPDFVLNFTSDDIRQETFEVITDLQARINRALDYIVNGADPEYGDVDTTALSAILSGEQQPADIAAQLCGDYPAPCNCDDPVNHGGRKRDFPAWLTRQPADSLTPEQLDYVNSPEFERDRTA